MNLMKKTIGKRNQLIFMDFEGTQITHELIAFGAVKCKINKKCQIVKTYKGIKYYVKATGKIGGFVKKLTGIDEKTLEEKGIPFKDAVEKMIEYCGVRKIKDTAFMFFGSHDFRILNQSLEHSNDANPLYVKNITHNGIDVSAILSTFVRDEHNNPYSLLNYMAIFDVPQVGDPHDPLTDSIHLMKLYQGFMNNSSKLFDEYCKVLSHKKEFPAPVTEAVNSLLNGQEVTPEEFKENIKKFIG